MPIVGISVSSDYRILISRAQTRPLADLYPFNLVDPIPRFPIPLQAEGQEPVVDLQALLNEVYERSGYDYFIDYHSDPPPPISEASLAWVITSAIKDKASIQTLSLAQISART